MLEECQSHSYRSSTEGLTWQGILVITCEVVYQTSSGDGLLSIASAPTWLELMYLSLFLLPRGHSPDGLSKLCVTTGSILHATNTRYTTFDPVLCVPKNMCSEVLSQVLPRMLVHHLIGLMWLTVVRSSSRDMVDIVDVEDASPVC